MKINIYSHQDNPSQIKGFTIVIDVFRAFTVSYYVWNNQPDRYLITNSIEHAQFLKTKYPKSILIGERDGVKIDGFDYGNSPSALAGKDFSGYTVIHTTTAGTKGVMVQPETNEVVVGSFVNKSALLDYIRQNDIHAVNLYCTSPPGWGDEDSLFAEHFKKLLLHQESNFEEIVDHLRNGAGQRLLNSTTEPAADFDFCIRRNHFDVVLKRKFISNDPNSLELVKAGI
jgi:2-phosphosulfolactate phosphatase